MQQLPDSQQRVWASLLHCGAQGPGNRDRQNLSASIGRQSYSVPHPAAHVQGYGVVREVERVATSEQDRPEHPCIVDDCGELPAGTDPTSFLQQVLVAGWELSVRCSASFAATYERSRLGLRLGRPARTGRGLGSVLRLCVAPRNGEPSKFRGSCELCKHLPAKSSRSHTCLCIHV